MGSNSRARRTALLVLIAAGAVVVTMAPASTGVPSARAPLSATAAAPPPDATPSVTTGLMPSGRQLTPAGQQVVLGNYPTGLAVTADGRFAWTVSSGFSTNEIRIVDLGTQKECQRLTVPGATGGIALDSVHRRAYVSGLIASQWLPQTATLPGATENSVLVYSWTDTCGQARLDRAIDVPPQPNPPTMQQFPAPRAGLPAVPLAWPQRLAISPDGTRVLVPLNLANSAAFIDVTQGDRVRYVETGSYPFGAAVLGRVGLVSNEASGTVSVVDMNTGAVTKNITVGPPLSHPQGIALDRARARAYVALSASDQVVVINLRSMEVLRTVSVGRAAGLGTMPVALAVDPAGRYLYAAESGADEIAVIQLPGKGVTKAQSWRVLGRIPTAEQPQAVATSAASGSRPARLMYLSAEGLGSGPNPAGPDPLSAADPIFWAFSSNKPTNAPFTTVQYLPFLSHGQLGILPVPTESQVRAMTPMASRQLVPTNTQLAPQDTPLRADGPIKHVFFIVRENRSYDQVLGDVAKGNGDPKLVLFGPDITPNLHSFVDRFPLLDGVFANSEASIQGHYWTASAGVPDYVTRNWVQQYAGRGRPNDFATYAVSWPGNGFIFNQADKQGISYFNYGEGFIGGYPSVPDRDRTPAISKDIAAVMAKSDIGPPFGGCYPGDMTIGTALDGGQIFDSSLPVGAPAGSYSHVDCFRANFAEQVSSGTVPALSYLSLTSDHTRGTQPGYPIPQAMVADSDLAIGQIVDTISHSPIWASSAIFIVEDDSQDGADHVDAHRIPVAVISPYAKTGAVVHTRYDLVSVVRSVELILGMRPLTINDALATPVYDAFSSTPVNASPVTALIPQVNLLQFNTTAAPDSPWSTKLELDKPDRVSQATLDRILWHAVRGADSEPPPPGPGAEGEKD